MGIYRNDPLRHDLTMVALAVLLYEFVFQGSSILFMTFGSDLFLEEGFALMVSGVVSAIPPILLLGFPASAVPPERPRVHVLLWFFLMMYGLQIAASMLLEPVENLIRYFGYPLEEATEIAAGRVDGFWMLLYSILGAPLFEEFMFRGVLFRPLRKHGRIFACFTSALIFALMHGNIEQFFTAVLLGTLFGFARDRYGLCSSIFLHIANNSFAVLSNNFGEAYPILEIILDGIIGLGVVVMLFSLFRYHRKIYRAIREESGLRRSLAAFFTTPMNILMILMFVFLTLINLY